MSVKGSRSWVSVSLAGVMLVLVATGFLSFALPYNSMLSGAHTWFGFIAAVCIALHLGNNWRPLSTYLRARHRNAQLASVVAVLLSVVAGVMFDVPPVSALLDFGFKLRKSQEVVDEQFRTLTTHVERAGIPVRIEIRVGSHYWSDPQPLLLGLSYRSTPQLVCWLETLEGEYLETLYVTKKIAESDFRLASLSRTERQRRPEALPYWLHKRGVVESDGLLAPLVKNGDLDGVTGATPMGHYDIKTKVEPDLGRVRLLVEVNRSYDFNEFYSKDRFPDDAVYSGSGSSGQPSLVYAANLELVRGKQIHVLSPIGHGHYSGANGELYKNLDGLDSALDLLDRIVVVVGGRSTNLEEG